MVGKSFDHLGHTLTALAKFLRVFGAVGHRAGNQAGNEAQRFCLADQRRFGAPLVG